ncbi:hypothetical protein [Hymenobacter sp. BT491]|uniref:hypothetical protein n=1 Tax=Hymenobacter sp. BT491 TaxID=2766779 RepID=UPI0016538712|nr:hypothetical protein [Hymenobacter sp. BT491]MBC6988962.1 hypothetical protein [Hymenobacter sp. BT491]
MTDAYKAQLEALGAKPKGKTPPTARTSPAPPKTPQERRYLPKDHGNPAPPPLKRYAGQDTDQLQVRRYAGLTPEEAHRLDTLAAELQQNRQQP